MKSIDQVQPRLQHIFRNAGGARVAVALGEAPDGVHLGFHVVLVAGHDVAEQLFGLRVDTGVSRGGLGKIVHVILVDPAAAERLHHGIQRAHFADILIIIQNGAIDPPIIVDEHALGGLNECLVVVHVQHHEEVVL